MKRKSEIESGVILPHKLYILMRNDLPSLTAGKAMAQSAHAANCLTGLFGTYAVVKNGWMAKDRPFGTTIILSVNESELLQTLSKAFDRNVIHGEVYDDTYPFMVDKEISKLISSDILTSQSIFKEDGRVVMFRKELTCGYVFVQNGSIEQKEIVGALPLYP